MQNRLKTSVQNLFFSSNVLFNFCFLLLYFCTDGWKMPPENEASHGVIFIGLKKEVEESSKFAYSLSGKNLFM